MQGISRNDDISTLKKKPAECCERTIRANNGTKLSIIIPALNEEKCIQQCIAQLYEKSANAFQKLEIIVVDGGSSDHTKQLARRGKATVVSAPKGRSNQMNAGFRSSTGDSVFFLHSDTQVPQFYDAYIHSVVTNPKAAAGAFRFATTSNRLTLRIVTFFTNLRTILFKLPYGDQGLFMRRSVFEQVGGYPDLPIMEDVEILTNVKKLGKLIITRGTVRTSARRWEKVGVIKTTLINQCVLVAYFLGVDSHTLANWYRSFEKKHRS